MSDSEPIFFHRASAVSRIDDSRFRADVPDGWQQGRGAFGGLAIGIAVRAMEAVETERPLRALTAEMPGPLLPGEIDAHVAVLRRGSGMTTLEATLVQGGETKTRVSGVFGTVRDDAVGPRIELGHYDSVPPAPTGFAGPPFSRFFEYRITGPIPFTGGEQAIVEGWIRPLGVPTFGAAEVAAMADAYWPAIYSTTTSLRPMATVTYTLQLTMKAHQLDPSAPLFYRARVLASDGGYVSELRELWAPDGALVAINPQTFVIIK